MMKTLAEFILTDFWVFPLSAGTKTISRIILISVCAALWFSPSLCVLFFLLLWIYALLFSLLFALFYLLLMPCFSQRFCPFPSSPVFSPSFFSSLVFLCSSVLLLLFSYFSLLQSPVFLSCRPPVTFRSLAFIAKEQSVSSNH